jgi:hypothetical protein
MACGAPFLKKRNAIFFWQTNIKNNRVKGLCGSEKMPVLAIISAIDGVTRLFQCGDNLTIEILIVLYNE